MKLKDRVAVVTGSGRGIGRAIALALAENGARVMVVSNVPDESQAVCQEIREKGGLAHAMFCDVTDRQSVEAVRDKTIEVLGKADVLVNNAGIVGKRCFLMEYQDDMWRRVIEVNLNGTYLCSKVFARDIMESSHGRIINIASISGKQASPTNAAYCASKHAVIGLTRTLATEFGMLGCTHATVNAICPGVVNTDMLTGEGSILDEVARLLGCTREEVVENRIKPSTILRKILEPEEIANMAVFLASGDASSITGQAINVCAGSVFY